jgi:hypothetical protein
VYNYQVAGPPATNMEPSGLQSNATKDYRVPGRRLK